MAAAGAFGVIGVNRAVLERGDRVFDESGFVQRVGMNRDLNVEFIRDVQALIDRCRSRAPVFMEFQTQRAGANLFAKRFGQRGVAFARNPKLSGNASAASYIRRIFHAPGVHVVALVPVAGPVPPPIRVVTPE